MNKTTTMRISKEVYNEIKFIAESQNENMQSVISKAIKNYKKIKFFDKLNSAYTAYKSDPDKLREIEEETKLWDITLSDGLD